ncbi:MAG: hypothetical protein ACYTFY_03730 [Planctomycetota bacterium]|jgi:hypothetical protein
MKKFALIVFAFAVFCSVLTAGGDHKKKQQKVRPNAEEVKALETITLKFEIKDGNLHLSWSPATSEESAGVKVAYSDTEKSPLYGFDSYAKWIPGSGHSSCVVPNKRAGSTKVRYYRICSVQKNHRKFVALSNVIEVPAIEKVNCKGGVCDIKGKGKSHASKCPGCGKKAPKSAKFCADCGKKLK